MDALSDVLRVANLSGGVFMHAEFTAPWCVLARVTSETCAPFLGPTTHLIPYHYCVEGELSVSLEKGEPQKLRSGDLVLFPRNDSHLMGSDLSLPPVRAGEIIRPPEEGGLHTIKHGKGGTLTRVICGYLGCDGANSNPVVASLPALMRLSVEQAGAAEWIRSTFQFAAGEIAAGRPGSATILAKISELLFVEAVRRFIEDLPPSQTGWLAGLRDPAVARALALLHGDIAKSWGVDELSREVGMSRSAFADRFTRLMGMPPVQYLTHWRMQVAARKLRDTREPLGRIAEAVGYESEAAFSRAFKKAFESAPATWRRSVN